MELDFQRIFKEFSELDIDYLVVGGLAVNLHGIQRMTYDLDFMISLDQENINKLVTKLSEWGYRPKALVNPIDLADEKKRTLWIKEKEMKPMSFYSKDAVIGEIDIVFDSSIPYRELKKQGCYD